MKTTLQKILKHAPCEDGWEKLLQNLDKTEADNEPLSLLTILESNGLDDALWALRAIDGYDREMRLFACWCACQSLHFFEVAYPDDMRPRQAIESAALFAEGMITAAARAAARDASRAAARDASWDAASAASRDVARDAARAAAWAAARAAAWAAAWDVTRAALRDARDAARAAAWDVQKEEFVQLCTLGKKYMPLI